MIHRPIALAASGLVIAGELRDAFEQGGLARAVLADDDGDRLLETKLEIIGEQRQREGIAPSIRDLSEVERDALEIGRRERERPVASSHRTTPTNAAVTAV